MEEASNGRGKKGVGTGRGRGKGVKLSTDAQSVAARERRHRISQRFKILQSLVPGGSKMDTVSMLDEAIHYVKFLKAQVWLLHQQSLIVSSLQHADPQLSAFVGMEAKATDPPAAILQCAYPYEESPASDARLLHHFP